MTISRTASVPVSREELARLRAAAAELEKFMRARANLEGKKTEMMMARRQARAAGLNNAFAEGWLACFMDDWVVAVEDAEQVPSEDLPF